ncbi:hypothetical protein B566_EDAN013389 [Ephemera danica]|nr:hypothetical protein B566_EDAN013389 [Ephemera danica]
MFASMVLFRQSRILFVIALVICCVSGSPRRAEVYCGGQPTPDCYAKGIRYPGDCTRYCVCEVGGAIEMRCPDGLYFDEPKGVCVWPWESCCTNSMSYPSCGIY